MAFEIPSTPPSRIVVGTTEKFTVELSDFLPTDGWVLTVTLIKADEQHTFTAPDNGDGTHLVTISSSAAESFTAGTFRMTGAVASSALSERYALNGESDRPYFEQDVEVVADYQAETGGKEARTTVQRVIDDLESLLVVHEADKGHVSSYNFPDGRSVVFQSPYAISEALKFWHGRRRVEIRSENIKRGRGNRGTIGVKF